MIAKEIKNGVVHTFSDAGLKIQRVDVKFPVNNAFEEVGKEHKWEEVLDNIQERGEQL